MWYDEVADPPVPSRQLEGLTIPSFPQLYRKIKGGKMPSGRIWEAYRTLYEMNNDAAAARGVAAGRAAGGDRALRRAVERLAHDKEFAAEAMKIVEYVPEYRDRARHERAGAQGDGRVAADARLHQQLHAQRTEETISRRRTPHETPAFCCVLRCVTRGHGALSAAAQEPYYKGKRLTVLINFAAGGPTDIEGRLFAKHLEQAYRRPSDRLSCRTWMAPAAWSARNSSARSRPRTAPSWAIFAGTSWIYVSDPARWRVDFKNYEFIAYAPGTTVHFVRTDVAPGLQAPADIVKAQGLIAGGLSIDTSKDLRLRLGLDMLGVPFKYVTGYRVVAAGAARAPAR